MKIKLCENSKQGHHAIYLEKLLMIDKTEENYYDQKIISLKNGIFRFFIEQNKKLKAFIKQDQSIYHFLYFDNIYVYPLTYKLNRKCKVIGTLHFVPQNKLKILFLKNFAKKINLIVVHSHILKKKLLKLGIKNVEVIDYPSFFDYKKISNKDELKDQYNLINKIVLTALGGTRDDKGLDILLNSFKYLDEDLKEKIVLNIAGKEERFKRDFIEGKIEEYKINARVQYGLLTDEEFMENVVLTDIMIMPYRKIFGGNSGPMTEAIVNRIPCITPKGLNIGEMTEKYNLGLTFECENSKDLAETIKKIVLKEKTDFYKIDFYKRLTLKNFLEKYERIYKRLEKGEYK